jgi:rubrerythrin
MEKHKQLSILIPAKSEEFLVNTIQDIVKNREADTEVIAVLDGEYAIPPIPQMPDVNIIYANKSVGQRGGTNLAARLSRAKYVAKADAHCAFDKGFDRKMIEGLEKVGDDVTMVPVMRNLHVFDWKCRRCNWTMYQDTKPARCGGCNDSRYLRKKIRWIAKERPENDSYCFNSEPHFHYFSDYHKREEYKKDKETGFTQSMSAQGSFFMCTRENYWKLKICDEELGNWGNQGIEVACKTWLSGGRVLTNHNTWYAHMFRTHDGFAQPWGASGKDIQKTKNGVWDAVCKNGFPGQKYPVSWLIDKFYPVGWVDKKTNKFVGWTDEEIKTLKETEFKPK